LFEIKGGRKMTFKINRDECILCGACQLVCPVSCISEMSDGKRVINDDECIGCGTCAVKCPIGCISFVQ
jgi:NAD-dependent dihydropyrimidine dehydrogenase PreA subunit